MHDKLILDNKFFSFPKQSVKRYVICTGRIYKMPFSMFVSGLYFFVCILYYTKKKITKVKKCGIQTELGRFSL